LFLGLPGISWADTLEDAARQLAARITSALAPRELIGLDVRNLSTLGAVDVAAARRALETQLAAHGVRLAAGSGGSAVVRVTLSENLEGYLWVAEIRSREAPAIVMVTLRRDVVRPAVQVAPAFALQKDLVWEQGQPILGLALFDDAGAKQGIAVLEPGRLALYEKRNDRWELARAFPIVAVKPWPRDLRGELVLERANAGAYEGEAILPGMLCTLKLQQDAAISTLGCERREPTSWVIFADAKPLARGPELVPLRNFLNLEPGPDQELALKVGSFFSEAILPGGEGTFLRLFSAVDGRVQLYGSDKRFSSSFRGWGSDLTSLKTGCGGGWQVLATKPGDWTQPDAVRAYEIREGVAVAVTAPVELPGPVTALGPLVEGAALAVARNLKTGRYEAYKISITCGP